MATAQQLLGVACVLVAALLDAPGAATADPHLRFMGYYGFNPDVQHEWLNLAVEASPSAIVAANLKYGLQGLVSDFPATIFARGKTTPPTGWEAALDSYIAETVKPLMANGTAVGVFFGDEICCHNTACWAGQLEPVSARTRAALGPEAVVYTNECAVTNVTAIPTGLSHISVDIYDGFYPGSNGTSEVLKAKAYYQEHIFPHLGDHQSAFIVPGTFACSNTTYMPLADSSRNLVEKLEGYFEWAKAEDRLAGINPWHFNNRSSPQHSPPCDMVLGAVAMPDVVAKLREIGLYIKGQAAGAGPVS